MGGFIVGILVGIFVMYKYAFGAYTLGKQQKQINKSIRKDLDFYKNLSEKYEEEIERERNYHKPIVVNNVDKVSIETFIPNIGRKTHKTSGIKKDNNHYEPNPFKSGLKVNTIKGVINHPQLNIPAYTFEEDDSYVECRRCVII